MYKFIISSCFLFFALTSTIAQKITSNTEPLVWVDAFQTDFNHFVVNPAHIETLHVIKDSAAIAKYGEAGKNGVIEIEKKKTATFLSLPEIYNHFGIDEEKRKLRVCIDKKLTTNLSFILIDKSMIKEVHVTTDKYWINAEDANSNERVLNIATRIEDYKN